MLTDNRARAQLNAWTKTDSLLKHARAVEIVMRAAATKYGDKADADRWAIAGLLHDADYEQWPEEHPKRIVDWLREQGEEDIAYAVSFHQTAWGLSHWLTIWPTSCGGWRCRRVFGNGR